MIYHSKYFTALLVTLAFISLACTKKQEEKRPNFLIIYTDDQRSSAIGYASEGKVHTPNLDVVAREGMIFNNAFVTLSICSPSRAALLTGRYGSANGVVTYGNVSLNEGERTFANVLKSQGYQTALSGKWHLKNTPQECGFDCSLSFFSNGPWYNRKVNENGKTKVAKGFIEKYIVDYSISLLDSMSQQQIPFVLFHCTQVPHLNQNFKWDVQQSTLDKYYVQERLNLPENWQDKLEKKPSYLNESRHRQRALEYGYANEDTLLSETKRYYAAITEMDQQLGRIFRHLEQLGIKENTYIIFMGDNGWFVGDHMFTSKVLAYEESMHVPLFITGPGIQPAQADKMVLNVDIMPTILDILGLKIPENLHGTSLLSLLEGKSEDWREEIFYEAPQPQLGSWPLWAIRTKTWKYIETYHIDQPDSLVYQELYNLENDPYELNNLAYEQNSQAFIDDFSEKIVKEKQLKKY